MEFCDPCDANSCCTIPYVFVCWEACELLEFTCDVWKSMRKWMRCTLPSFDKEQFIVPFLTNGERGACVLVLANNIYCGAM